MDKAVRCRKIDGSTMEVPLSILSFKAAVYGVIIKDGKVLLVPQWDGYDLPGGGIEMGETMFAAVIREIKEETGIDVRPAHVLTVQDDFFFHPVRQKALQSLLVYFLCDLIGGEITDAGFDRWEHQYARKAEWVEIEKIPALKFHNPVDNVKLISEAVDLQRQLQLEHSLAHVQ